MGKIKKFNEYFKIEEGMYEPVVKPTPVITPSRPTKKPSPIRRDKPSVEPGPKAVTDTDLANKFLNLTSDNKSVQKMLAKKYNK